MRIKCLIFIAIIISSSKSFSQTPKETLKYLKLYYSELRTTHLGGSRIDYENILISNGRISGSFIVTDCISYQTNQGCLEYRTSKIKCDRVTGISLYFQPYELISENELEKIIVREAWYLDIHYENNQKIKISLEPTDETYARRLKNAITKLVEYSGAVLTDESLFD